MIDLSLAPTGSWNLPSPSPGNGVYDPDQWAVVFKYSTIDIPSTVTVTFKPHPSGAPVVWLATGNVTIAGVVSVDAPGAVSFMFPAAAPGGFQGGQGGRAIDNLPSAGLGPGGGRPGLTIQEPRAGEGGYASTGGNSSGGLGGSPYGNSGAFPLIGGSGGGGGGPHIFGNSGGSGGGAILIASSQAISVSTVPNVARINAAGALGNASGGGGGSGGAIRMIAPTIFATSGGTVAHALGRGGSQGGGSGSDGRIRLEADTFVGVPICSPNPVTSHPNAVFPPSTAPRLRATFVANQPVPSDPLGGIQTEDVSLNSLQPVTIAISANNVPLGTTVSVRIVPDRGDVIIVPSTPLAGTFANSTATAIVTFPSGRSEVALRANWNP